MKRRLTLGSLFSGSGGFELAGSLVGIKPVWNSEIAPFPIRVTSKRFPNVKHYGDINDMNGAEIEPVDIITFGSPCQDLSVAGRREGLSGERSGLFMQAIRVIKEMRESTNGEYPGYILWENVPGALSSQKGQDFRIVLEEICKIADETVYVPMPESKWTSAGEVLGDGFSIAWRVLDAQHFGVPQRRKRVFLVADFRGQSAGQILFESESLYGNFEPSRAARQITAGTFKNSPGATGETGIVFENHSQDNRYTGPLNIMTTVSAKYGTGGNNQPFVVKKQAFGVCAKNSNSMKSDNPNSGFYKADTSRTLDGNGENPTCNQGGMAVVEKSYSIQGNMIGRKEENGPQGCGINEDVSFTLNATDRHAVYAIDRAAYNQGKNAQFDISITDDETAQTVVAKGPGAVAIEPTYTVRRLTPLECCRLQGFPDGWTDGLETPEPTEDEIQEWLEIFETYRKATGSSTKPKTGNQIIKWLKNPYSDSALYMMWGNGIALPCAEFVLWSIVNHVQSEA